MGYVNLSIYVGKTSKKVSGQKISMVRSRGSQSRKAKFSPIGQFGRKPDFQEFLGGRMKIAIARPFLDQLTPFLQMEAKTHIYVVQCHFGANLFILVPNLKCKVKNYRF